MLRTRIGSADLTWTVFLLVLVASCAKPDPRTAPSAPVLPGIANQQAPSEVRGRVLLGELGCTACHPADPDLIEHRPAPALHQIASRVQANYLTRYLLEPHEMEPGTTMPDVLRQLPYEEATVAAKQIAHYLRSFGQEAKADSPQPVEADPILARRGKQLFEEVGCKACHARPDEHLYACDKYTPATLQAFLLAPHAARPADRMPNLALTPAEARELAHFLVSREDPAQPPQAAAFQPDQVAAGREHFANLGCANCHALPDPSRAASPQAKPLTEVDPTAGCLSSTSAAHPRYGLTDTQREDIRTALASIATPLLGEARIQQLMASRNCFACHTRGDVDSVTGHQDVFLSNAPSLGQDGRLPPTLTGVGGKLQRDWLELAIAHGQRERPYLKTRMPGFGDAFAKRLTALLVEADQPPATAVTPLPSDRKEAEKVVNVGRELIGDKGMNCVSCHLFAGEQAGALAAIDLVHATGKRLRPEWFAAFLRDPFTYKPTTLMPLFFPDGKTTRPQFCNGDTTLQIDAMWHYLAKGRNVRKPRGISRPPIKLEVGDEAVMLRRSVQETGKRGISVGYPGGVNITFDAENLGVNQIWWGEFVDARPVWTGQGSGQARILGKQRTTLPNGPAFAELADPKGRWPSTTRRDRGDRFLGYDLDAQQRPTLRYTVARAKAPEITIADTPRQATSSAGKTHMVRTLELSGNKVAIYFRAATHKQMERIDKNTVRVGSHLQVRCADALGSITTIAGQDEKELRYFIATQRDPVSIALEYHWMEEGK